MTNVIELAKQAGFHFWDAGFADKGILHTTGDKFSQKCFERFAVLVGNAKLEEAAQKCVASELIDMPTRHEIATVRKCAKAIESLKEPT